MGRYIIFGAGRYGREALYYYGIKNVAYFCDNKKYGQAIDGIEVINFSQMADISAGYEIILAVTMPIYKKEIQQQLEGHGITYTEFHTLEGKLQENNFSGEYVFFNRSKEKEKLLMILAGYKEYLWDSVLARVRGCIPEDMDVCVMTAGYRNSRLEGICRQEGWSYLYTYENKLSLTQNVTIQEHPAAKWIYKMDEDIFVTPGMFGELLDTYRVVEQEKRHSIGFVAPLMPVNSYGYRRVLELLGLVAEYEKLFNGAVSGMGSIFGDANAASYMWEKTLPINTFAEKMKLAGKKYSICYHRFSIGCILMHRDIWKEMGGFKVAGEGVLGIDEEYLCQWCMNNARAIIVAERAVAGHFSYGLQTEGMRGLYEKHRDEFDGV